MRFLLSAVLLSAALAWCRADDTVRRELRAVRLSSPPTIDAKLDDRCWKEVEPTSGFSDEMLGTKAKDDTIIWIGYDDKAIYVAFHALDHDPARIVARETKRGAEYFGEDRVRLRVNPFNSRRGEDESEINLNALGTQMAEFAGGRANKQEWEGEWQGAARIVEDGWIAEMAVPWTCFVRPRSDGKPTTIGINFDRYQARTQIKSYWSNLGRHERRELGGRWVGLILPPTKRENPLSAMVYAYGGYDEDGAAARAGLDARYRFSPSFTGVLTANPDFSNVEGAVTSIDFSYSEKLPDERRPFFLEGGDYLESPLRSVRPFASVRLGSLDTGLKLFGRVRPGTDLGVLAGVGGGGRTDAVVKLAHQFSPFDSFTFQGVSRTGAGVDNQVGLAVGRVRRGDWMLQGAYGRSYDRTGPGELTDIWLYYGSAGWYSSINYEQTSRNLQARDGYVSFLDQKGVSTEVGYWAKWRSGGFTSGSFELDVSKYDHLDGSPFRESLALRFSLETVRQLQFSFGARTGIFEGQRDRVLSAAATYPSRNAFCNFGFGAATGRIQGEEYWRIGPSVVWRFFDRLSTGLSSEIVHMGKTDRQHIFTVAYDLSRDQSIGGRIVSGDDGTNGYLSYRKSGYGGTEYFLILGDPNAQGFSNRLVAKVVHPL
ncbi:MAG: hypothetical protein FJX72_11920 [Armatimonadetes bacterium]|nr:hypothetical protein [Armatimonadota bacterium]